ncbi:cytochrome-c oxidase, cbb3-type subunit III [Amaricoccus solimangrovi]|uniref:Cbb3-type cytochrome c oxidase subunit n=1 Tax=Amaricoccus solimangrovi TaxID=2589815 RepID=A0A501WRJ2_9RHOB|nr:cytochrome-c oxidase, cbb3-type subunit III [Amaricoccus solimangrovi]TPE50704.1 cytochrome-c oxidase, cbb3-type subunit III [Amaricoccus solimangrovi]
MATKREFDEATRTETTGHEWDGIRELDTPMPRWWLWTFYGTIVWGIVYVILFPAWPLVHGATPGILGYSSRANVAADLRHAAETNAPLDARLMRTDIAAVEQDPELLSFAMAGGGAVFRNNCSQCHGAGGGGMLFSYPNLVDDDWLWGGAAADIEQTVTHGIRYEADPDTRYSQMPSFGEMLEPAQIDALVQHVESLSGNPRDAALAAEGAPLFAENCAACHGEDGAGGREFGAPNLTDRIWLYGGDPSHVHASIAQAHFGIMPAFGGRLSPSDIRKVAIYVHTLGGGE